MRELTTSIDIDAPPERVWDVLTDFERYPEWNPTTRIVGRPNEGAHLTVDTTLKGRTMRFRPEVTAVERDRELRWLGHLYVPGLFDGEHRFVLEPLDGGRTRFVQAETFRGLLVGPVLRLYGDATEAGFEAVNRALKDRAESLEAAAGTRYVDGPDALDAGSDADAPESDAAA